MSNPSIAPGTLTRSGGPAPSWDQGRTDPYAELVASEPNTPHGHLCITTSRSSGRLPIDLRPSPSPGQKGSRQEKGSCAICAKSEQPHDRDVAVRGNGSGTTRTRKCCASSMQQTVLEAPSWQPTAWQPTDFSRTQVTYGAVVTLKMWPLNWSFVVGGRGFEPLTPSASRKITAL